MAIEEGIIVSVTDDGHARVKTRRCEACDHCAAREGCRVMGGGKEVEFLVKNTLDAAPGDRVAVGVSDASFMKATFLVYFVPMMGLVAGALLGNRLAAGTSLDPEAAAVLLGLAGFAVTFAAVRLLANKLGAKTQYQPYMAKILKRAERAKE
ncbi:MAG: SoxR reducing system RseC family protein [Deltaproteobacteria bacterium]|nr:SoxR reducing system RseC family protein [Deltaproteobacteria bacterium]